MRFILLLSILLISSTSCQKNKDKETNNKSIQDSPYIYILGTAQDGGHPHAGCEKKCCKDLWKGGGNYATSFALVDPERKKYWLFEATPDIKYQLNILNKHLGEDYKKVPNGIFLTHAHIGHYSGLMHFGHEVMGTKRLPVYAMAKMGHFLKTNGPWSQLFDKQNIKIRSLRDDFPISLGNKIKIEAFIVPHRDEFSETVGFKIKIDKKNIAFIPDIDKWDRWDKSVTELVKNVDIALLDATFYNGEELPDRDISKVIHPFVTHSMDLFSNLSLDDKKKIHFIHLNHTNPMLNKNSEEYMNVVNKGFKVAETGVLN